MRPIAAPAESLVGCPKLPEPVDNSVDAYLHELADVVKLYGDCATRHDALIKAVGK